MAKLVNQARNIVAGLSKDEDNGKDRRPQFQQMLKCLTNWRLCLEETIRVAERYDGMEEWRQELEEEVKLIGQMASHISWRLVKGDEPRN